MTTAITSDIVLYDPKVSYDSIRESCADFVSQIYSGKISYKSITENDKVWVDPILEDAKKYSIDPSKENKNFFFNRIKNDFNDNATLGSLVSTYTYFNGVGDTGAKSPYEYLMPKNATLEQKLSHDIAQSIRTSKFYLMKDTEKVPYIKNPFTNHVYRDANQTILQMENQEHGHPYINYAPTVNIYMKGWRPEKDKAWTTVCYAGKDPVTGEKKYMVTMPTKNVNQHVFKENLSDQKAMPSIEKISVSDNRCDDFLAKELSRYLNAAFTKTPFEATKWDKEVKDSLIQKLEDPKYILQASKTGYALASGQNNEQVKVQSNDITPSRSAVKTRTQSL